MARRRRRQTLSSPKSLLSDDQALTRSKFFLYFSLCFSVISLVFSVLSPETETDNSSLYSIPVESDSTSSFEDTFHPFLSLISSSSSSSDDYDDDDDIIINMNKNTTLNLTWSSSNLSPSIMEIDRTALFHHPYMYLIVNRTTQTPMSLFCAVPGAASNAILIHFSMTHDVHPLSVVSIRDRERLLSSSSSSYSSGFSVPRFLFVRHPFLRALAQYRLGMAHTRKTNHTFSTTTSSQQNYNNKNHETVLAHENFLRRVRIARALVARLHGFNEDTSHEDEQHMPQRDVMSFRMFLALLSMHFKQMKISSSQNQHQYQFNEMIIWQQILSQASLCHVHSIKYSFVGHVETLKKDLRIVNKWLGIHRTILPKYWSSGAQQHASTIFANHHVRRKAMRVFKEDLQTFGYSPKEF